VPAHRGGNATTGRQLQRSVSEAPKRIRINSVSEVKEMRVRITLQCTETGDRNYITNKNKKNNPERIELKKYSPRLKRYTIHRETK
jgi:large subunit ribosomal protein L33